MPRNFVFIFGFIAATFFSAPYASAETIELKNGRTVEANILSFSDNSVTVETSGETRIVPNADISKINGRSLTADLTVVGLQNQPPEKKQTFGNIFSRIQKKSDDKNKSLIEDIKRTIEKTFRSKLPAKQSSNNKSLPDWFWPVVISLIVAFYLFLVIPYCMMAEKLGLSSGWQFLTIVPVLQLLAMLKISAKPLWWFLLFFIPIVNVVILVMMYCGMAERCGKEKWLGILMLIPVVNILLPWLLVSGVEKKEEPTKHTTATGKPLPQKRYAITPFEDETPKP